MGSTRTNVYGPELQCRTEWGTGTGNHSGKGGGCRVWWHLASSNGCMCPCDGSHDTTRSTPYNIQEVYEVFGISCAFDRVRQVSSFLLPF